MIHPCLALASLALLAPVVAQDGTPAREKQPQHLLRLAFVDGDPTWSCVLQDITARVQLGSGERVDSVRLEFTWETRVQHGGEGGTQLVRTIRRVRGAGRASDGGTYVYDSAQETDPPLQMREFATLVGAEVTLEVDARGRVRKLVLAEALRALDGAAPFKVSDMVRPFDLELPELPVAVGESWPGGAGHQVESSYTLLAVEAGEARIGQRVVDPSAGSAARREAKREVRERSDRVFTLDLRTGRVVAVEAQTLLEGSGGGGAKVSFTYRMQRTSTILAAEPEAELAPLEVPAVQVGQEAEAVGRAPLPAATSRPATREKKQKQAVTR